MGDYAKRKKTEPSSVTGKTVILRENQQQIDVDKLADTLVTAIAGKMQMGGPGIPKDSFNDAASMEKLVDSMTVQRGSKVSNFDDLGQTKTTEADPEVDKTIDLLKDLD